MLVPIQIGLACLCVAALTLAPPADGPMALIALDGRDADALIPPALAQDAALIGRGPVANILLVAGRRDRIALPMLLHGVIAVAAPKSWCTTQEVRS